MLQGDWSQGGRVFRVSGTSGRLLSVDAAAGKAGYAPDDVLVQGLTYNSTTDYKNGGRQFRFSGACRLRGPQGGWVSSDCELHFSLPGGGGAAILTSRPGGQLIAGQRGGGGAPPQVEMSGGPVVAVAPPVVDVTAGDGSKSWARSQMAPGDLSAQDAATARLNAEAKARATGITADEQKKAADYRAAKAAADAKAKANSDAYARQMADYQASVAAHDAAIAQARADWEAAVKACRAGDQSKCAQRN